MQVRVRRVRRDPRRGAPEHARVRLAARRRKRRIILGALALVLLALLAGGGIYALNLPLFSIQTVTIEGEQVVPEALIRAYVETQLHDGRFHLIPRQLIFAYPAAEIISGLHAQFPRLNTILLSRSSFFGTDLHVAVTERNPAGIWCSDPTMQACYDMDGTGFIYAPADGFAEYVLFFGGMSATSTPIGSYFEASHFAQVQPFITAASAAGFDTKTFTMTDANDFDVLLTNGLIVKGSFDYSDDELISSLTAAASADSLRGKLDTLEYIDLRFGNRVYYRFK